MTRRATWLKPPGPVAPGLRIGLLGGSFNPAHEGHLHVSEVALKKLGLDYVWWLVSPQNPLKTKLETAPLEQRIASAHAQIGRHPHLRVSNIESQMGTQYTIDTVKRLKRRFPQLRFVWLMGSDNLDAFHRWRNWREMGRIVPIAVVMRPGTILSPLKARAAQTITRAAPRSERALASATPPALVVLDTRRSSASATAIRERGLGRVGRRMLD